MVIFTKKFGTLDPHLPIVWDKVPNKTVFLGTFPKPFNFGDLPDAEIKSDKKTKRRNPLDVNLFHQLGQAEDHWSEQQRQR